MRTSNANNFQTNKKHPSQTKLHKHRSKFMSLLWHFSPKNFSAHNFFLLTLKTSRSISIFVFMLSGSRAKQNQSRTRLLTHFEKLPSENERKLPFSRWKFPKFINHLRILTRTYLSFWKCVWSVWGRRTFPTRNAKLHKINDPIRIMQTRKDTKGDQFLKINVLFQKKIEEIWHTTNSNFHCMKEEKKTEKSRLD